MTKAILSILLLTGSLSAVSAMSPAAQSINATGIDLWRATSSTNANLLLSPYSIQSALAMTYAGAAGATREEMMKVLHFPKDDATLHDSFAQLKSQLEAEVTVSAKSLEQYKKYGGSFEPMALHVANRLYAHRDYAFKTNYFQLLAKKYDTSLVPVDFQNKGSSIRNEINQWVEVQTQQRIRELIPGGGLQKDTRLVLVNALYFKATWADEFLVKATKPEPFKIHGGAFEKVPTMLKEAKFGYTKLPGAQAITPLPFS